MSNVGDFLSSMGDSPFMKDFNSNPNASRLMIELLTILVEFKLSGHNLTQWSIYI